jgi:hypothetical protein
MKTSAVLEPIAPNDSTHTCRWQSHPFGCPHGASSSDWSAVRAIAGAGGYECSRRLKAGASIG